MGGLLTDVLAKGYEAGPLKGIISDETALGFSKAGTWLKDTLQNRFEPLYKKMWADGEKDITDAFGSVHPNLHQNLHDVVTAGARPTTPEVAAAARKLGHVQVDPNFTFTGKNLPNEWVRANGSASKKLARQLILGDKDQALTAVVRAANRERGIAHANNVADIASMYFHDEEMGGEKFRKAVRYGAPKSGIPGIGIRETSPYSAPKEFERSIRKGMSYSFLGRIAIPHLGQVMNPVLDVGIKNVSKAIAEIATDRQSAMTFAKQAGVYADELLYETEHMGKPGSLLSKLGSAIDRPGFSFVRRQELLVSAVAGKHAALEAASQGAKGSVKDAEIMLKWLGLDPNSIAQRGWKLTQDEIDKAAYSTARRNMFIKSELTTPSWWHQNHFLRLMFAYKDYIYQQGGLIKDVLMRDKQRGAPALLKSIATLSVAFPVVGELIWSLENVATGHDVGDRRNEEGLEQWLDAAAHVGAAGIFYSMMRSGNRRSLAQWGVGPFFGTITDMVQDGMSGVRTGNYDPLGRDISTKVPVIGPYISDELFPKKGEGR